MQPMIPVGPYRTLTTNLGQPFPYYVIPFDANGICEGPRTQQHLLDHVDSCTDIFLFSHGWNNDWATATKRYENFIQGYQEQQRSLKLPASGSYQPLLAGIFWPSQALEWFESEIGPKIAAAPGTDDTATDSAARVLRDIAAALPMGRRKRFAGLTQATELAQPEATELAQMLASLARADKEGVQEQGPTAQDLLGAAQQLSTTSSEPDYDNVGTAAASEAAPQAAGVAALWKALDPRNILKPFTVWQMKDRAGTVGYHGVGPLLSSLLKQSKARIHLLGHSYGCKVVMSALSSTDEALRPVDSALLLQPAISQYAFAEQVPERPAGQQGGFYWALRRVRGPVVATFSANDVPLTKIFQIAVRRYEDLGEELSIAIAGAPSLYGALGGFGPQGSKAEIIAIKDAGQAYSWGAGGRIIGINGSRTIHGHGDISNPSTWWLAFSIASATYD
jgi:hypothetical protein